MQGTTEEKDSWLYQHFTRDIPKHEIDHEKFDIAGPTVEKPGRAESTIIIEKPGRAELTTAINNQERYLGRQRIGLNEVHETKRNETKRKRNQDSRL